MTHLSGTARQANAVTVIKIDKDYITSSVNEVLSDNLLTSCVGLEWKATPGVEYDYSVHAVAPEVITFEKMRFRVLDDDGGVYYGGWLYNDPQGSNQLIILKWAEASVGATEIQVKQNGEWITEIG